MPWTSSEREISRRPSLQAMSGGGFQMYQKPNPNDPVENLKRGFVATGDPRKQANVAQLQEDAARTSQAEAAKDAAYGQQMHDEGRIDTVGAQSIHNLNRGAQAGSPWTLFLQAMKNQGVDRMSTGGAAQAHQGGSDELGFYDTQRPSMAGLRTIGQQQRQTQVNNFMANQGGRY